MLISLNNRFYKAIHAIKKGQRTEVYDKAHPQIIEKGIQIENDMIVFNNNWDNWVCMLGDIPGKQFLEFFKSVVLDTSHKHRVFCNNTFYDFIHKKSETIKKEWLMDLKDEKGIILVRNSYMIYDLENKGEYVKLTMYMFQPNQGMSSVNAYSVSLLTNKGETVEIKEYNSLNGNNGSLGEFKVDGFLPLVIYDFLRLFFFLQYAQVETKIVNNKSGKVILNKQKILNQTDIPVEVIDSNYFTTIIRTEGFGVSGHWRLQPKGTGRLDRELIWIKDYKKNGYKREAKILKTE